MFPGSPLFPRGTDPFSSDFALTLLSNNADFVKFQKKIRMPRKMGVTMDILTGHHVLLEAAELARLLWNDLYALLQERNQEGEKWFQTWYEVRDTLRPVWKGRLSDKCFGYTVHEFDNAVRSWLQVRRTNPKANPPGLAFQPRPVTSTLGQNAKAIKPWTFRLTLLGQEYQDRHLIVQVKPRPEVRMRQIRLIQVRPGNTSTLTYYIDSIYQTPGENIAGIDLGICNLAAIAFQSGESTLYKGRALLDLNRYYAKRMAKCGPSIKPDGQVANLPSPHSLAYRAKLSNLRHLAIHNLTSSIIAECLEKKVGTIVLGRLTHIRSKKFYNQTMRQKLKVWPFDKMTRQIIYKAKAVGIKVILVNEAYTSQNCHCCGQRGQRMKRGLFHCSNCGLTINADINGAFNILNKAAPVRAFAGIGVRAFLLSSGQRNDASSWPNSFGPTHVARFKLGSFTINYARCQK